ncbi:hypothetical protein [uncultured Arcobacter sp.]|uniref:hypothetical protein n=1 Tax=uncultured Arcobacter sp. TaxID=165434 RepID=UPI0026368BEF|nr:hypothetical protein [uncultured Arcobacter sp.]
MITKYKQLIPHGKSDENGDCFRTAVACLMNIPPEEVPHFCSKENTDWSGEFMSWLQSKGYTTVNLEWGEWVEDCLKGTYHLLLGISPRFEGLFHEIVGYEGYPFHDPHPDNSMITDDTSKWQIKLIIPKHFNKCKDDEK